MATLKTLMSKAQRAHRTSSDLHTKHAQHVRGERIDRFEQSRIAGKFARALTKSIDAKQALIDAVTDALNEARASLQVDHDIAASHLSLWAGLCEEAMRTATRISKQSDNKPAVTALRGMGRRFAQAAARVEGR